MFVGCLCRNLVAGLHHTYAAAIPTGPSIANDMFARIMYMEKMAAVYINTKIIVCGRRGAAAAALGTGTILYPPKADQSQRELV